MESRKGKFVKDGQEKVKFVEDENGQFEVLNEVKANYFASVDPIDKAVDDLFTTGISVTKVSADGIERIPYPSLFKEMQEISEYYGTAIMEEKPKAFIGIDNGVSGTIGIITGDGKALSVKTPTKIEQSYTKAKAKITRIDVVALKELLSKYSIQSRVIIERPMVNPGRFKATVSALRALEATICVLEALHLPFEYTDSKEWQKVLLPKGCSGDELKKASLDIGNRLYPNLNLKHEDRDGMLIAHYCYLKYK